jgi:hypothetical protein
MSQLVALSVSIALLGGVATMLYQTQSFLIWAGFIAWAAFFGAGGDTAALKKTIAGSVFGAIVAALALVLFQYLPVEGWLWIPRNGVVVAVTVLILGLASKVELLSHLPANVYGYAATFAATRMASMATPVAPTTQLFSAPHVSIPLFNVIVSMVVGALFGLASGKLAAALQKS